MLNITVDTKKVPSLDTERSAGYWQNVLSRPLHSLDALLYQC